MLRIVFLALLIIHNLSIIGQQRWENQYFEGENPYGESIIEDYDNGYLLAGRFNPNYPSFCWLMKTNINGEVLWYKVLGDESSSNLFSSDICINPDGDIFLAGSSRYYGIDDTDPIVMKLNSCGEKEWCKVFRVENNNYSQSIKYTNDGGIVVLLMYMNENPILRTDRVCLAKLDINGSLLWQHCYNSPDTLLWTADPWNVVLSPDNGFLITAGCSYTSIIPPHMESTKPYFLKVDSTGILEWEKVVYSDTDSMGGESWTTVLSPDSNYYYSSISHYYRSDLYGNSPALLKMDLVGNIIDIYDLKAPSVYGKLFFSKFVNDSTLAGSAVWGNSVSPIWGVTFDTEGEIQNTTPFFSTNFMFYTEVTKDKKILFLVNNNDDDFNFSTHLFKLNDQLVNDTINTEYFVYDSLCPYPISIDTIRPDGCGLIVGGIEIKYQDIHTTTMDIFPNPASDNVSIKCDLFSGGGALKIIGINGNTVLDKEVQPNTKHITLDVSDYPKGIYLINFTSNNGKPVSSKLIIN